MPNKTNVKKKTKSIDSVCSVPMKPRDSKEQDENDEGEAEEKDTEDYSMLGHYITKEYELLRLVLSYLPLRDLHAAAQVCKMWQSAVEVIKRSRVRPHWMLWHCRQKEPLKEELPHIMFSHHFYSEPQMCLMFMTRRLSTTEICCRRAKAPCPMQETCKRHGRCGMSHRVIHYMRAELHDCPCILIEGFGVVGSSHDLSYTMEIEENFNAYSGVLLPRAPGVFINVFRLSKTDCTRLHGRGPLGIEEMESLTGFPSTMEPIRCLLLFCKDRHSKGLGKLVAALEARQGSKFAVGGGSCDRINLGTLAPLSAGRHVCVVGIALSGEGVRAASTIINSEVAEEEQVAAAMDELRSCQLPGQDSIGFMFACVGRGVGWYLEDNVESACFRHHFPRTPLVGFFGAGEIGHRFLPSTENAQLPAKRQRQDDPKDKGTILHSYTSVFVFLSFARQRPA